MRTACPASSSPTRYEAHPRSSSTNCLNSTAATVPAAAAISPEVLRRFVLLAVLPALVLPGAASAHARLVRTSPANGAVLAKPPDEIRVVFDDVVKRGGGIEAIRNGGGSVLAGDARVVGGNVLVLPLKRGLPRGAYSARWSIVSDDGHLESGIVGFAFGRGEPAP